MKVAKEGAVFYLPSLALFLLTLVLGWWLASLLFLLLSAAFLFFFRDPERRSPQDQNLVLSPADGQVIKIEEFSSHPDIGGPGRVISIFLSLLDVHFTRSPLAATVERVDYQPGKFFPAYREEASSQNESNSLVLATDRGRLFLKQMVGVAARRIKCYVKPGDRIAAGQKIGLMYFGSRVDLYLPASVELKVSLNQKVKGGLSLIGEWRDESKN
ncbi:MAG TPA: phosphatidylserine decarboxylase family protein [Acidobacteria bacterium]|nr:phosphatidylserine decarboxylase family protein [Acidobacteriota bacterium]